MRYSSVARAILRSRRMKFPAFAAATLLLFSLNSFIAKAQTVADSNIVISQIYTRGGETGAIYQNDFIELYNRGNSIVDINGWMLHITTFEGSVPSVVGIRFVSS